MVPPKKDAFADLFQSAAGNSNLSLNLLLNNLSMRDLKLASNRTSSPNMDVLSPSCLRSQALNSATPVIQSDFDPFSIFDQKDIVKTLSAQTSKSQRSGKYNITDSNFEQQQKSEYSLLDDDFVDAFQPKPLQDKATIDLDVIVNRIQNAVQNDHLSSVPSARAGNRSVVDSRDSMLAELVDIGFTWEVANRAIDDVGPNLQACVNYIMNEENGSSHKINPSASQDLGTAVQDISIDLFKKASKLFDRSKRTVIKNINQFQGSIDTETKSDGMPTWMREQEKYKERASERKKDGGVYVDYGDDEENINTAEIQRIIQEQKQRKRERQQKRFQNMKKENPSKSSSTTPNPDSSLEPGTEKINQQMNTRSSTPTKSRNSSDTSQGKSTGIANGDHVPHDKPSVNKPVDLLGIASPSFVPGKAEKFELAYLSEGNYLSPSKSISSKVGEQKPKNTTNEILNAFQQSDYDTFKARASDAFNNGNYDEAYQAYCKCLESLPLKHELRIVIFSNLALTLIKMGNFKPAIQNCDEGLVLVGENVIESNWVLNSKLIKFWYIRLLTRKAESLEMLENYPESLRCYLELITKFNVTEKKVLDAKSRISKVVNPPKLSIKPKNADLLRKPGPPSPSNNEAVKRIRDQHKKEKAEDEKKFELHDQVHQRIVEWSRGKEDNLRTLLISLSDVLPPSLGFWFITDKKITINDLMLTKKVKINYMKVISSIHPDKLGKYKLEEQMLCQGVFVTLNKAWDNFKEQNNII